MPMGDHASNIYLRAHRNSGALLGVALGKHLGAGNPIAWSAEISPAMYASVRAQAQQSQGAFDAAASAAWGPWYLSTMTTPGERADAREHVIAYAA